MKMELHFSLDEMCEFLRQRGIVFKEIEYKVYKGDRDLGPAFTMQPILVRIGGNDKPDHNPGSWSDGYDKFVQESFQSEMKKKLLDVK